MEVNERISEILRYSQLSIKEFVLKTGIKTIQAVYDLLNGRTKSISASVEIPGKSGRAQHHALLSTDLPRLHGRRQHIRRQHVPNLQERRNNSA